MSPGAAHVSTTVGTPRVNTGPVVVNAGFSPLASSNSKAVEPSRSSTLEVAAGISSKRAAVVIVFTVQSLDFARLFSLPRLFEKFQRHLHEALASEVGNWIPPDWIKLQLKPGSVRVSARLEAFSKDEADAWHTELRASIVPMRERLASSISTVPGISAACTGQIGVTDVRTARAGEVAKPDDPAEYIVSSHLGIQIPVLEAAPLLLLVVAGGASLLLLVVLLPLPSSVSNLSLRHPSHIRQATGGSGDASKQYAMLSGHVGLSVVAPSRTDPSQMLATRPVQEKRILQDCTNEADPEQQKLQQPETQQQTSALDDSWKTARSRGWSSIYEVLPEQDPLAQQNPAVFNRRPRGESEGVGLLA
mmetsp:Transcript_124968/g.249512  ORF Transcript_124968/g.249512 Transcript_124968/m.249512 type:complete len:362 (-) Transcript_124968:97-1182(-)